MESADVTAFPINYTGVGTYAKSLGNQFGVVLEDDGATGYFYATDGAHSMIFDALHIYDRNATEALRPGEEIFAVWNPLKRRVGLFYRNQFHAIFDFSARRGVCRNAFPRSGPAGSEWSKAGHAWDDEMIVGIEPS